MNSSSQCQICAALFDRVVIRANLDGLKDFGLFTLKYTGDSNRCGLALPWFT